MAINRLKVMLSFMREISDGNMPKADDYEIEQQTFEDILIACQEEGLIKDCVIYFKGLESGCYGCDCSSAKLTVKGMEYLHNNSAAMKAYKGLKEIREWLPF